MNINDVYAIFDEAKVYIDKDQRNGDVWRVQNAVVVKHAALERLGAAFGINWDKPEVLRKEADECVLMIGATRADKPNSWEWTIGEARVVPMLGTGRKNQWDKEIMEPAPGAIGNYQITPKQGAYPYAMAEKRAKDRLILKLANLHGAYSEEEAGDFNRRNADEEDDRRQAPSRDDRQVSGPSAEQRMLPPPDDRTGPEVIDAMRTGSGLPPDETPSAPEQASRKGATVPDDRTPEQKAEAMKAKLKSFTTTGDVAKFMSDKKVKAALLDMGEELAKQVTYVAQAHQKTLQASARKARADAVANGKDGADASVH